jgi:hypothetical protein
VSQDDQIQTTTFLRDRGSHDAFSGIHGIASGPGINQNHPTTGPDQSGITLPHPKEDHLIPIGLLVPEDRSPDANDQDE